MNVPLFTSTGGTNIKTAIVITILVSALAFTGVSTNPLALATIWFLGLAVIVPLRWTRVSLPPGGIAIQRGYQFFTGRSRFVHDSQIREIKQILTEQLSLLLILTDSGSIRVETADLPRRALVAALEERYGPIEIMHTFYAPFGPLKR